MADPETPKTEDDRDALDEDALDTTTGGGGAYMPHRGPAPPGG